MVLLQPLHVGLQRLCGLVPPPGIHGDSDSPGKLLVDASELRREGESGVSIPQLPTARQGSKHCQHGRQSVEKGWASAEGPTTPPTKGALVCPGAYDVALADFCRWISPEEQSATLAGHI